MWKVLSVFHQSSLACFFIKYCLCCFKQAHKNVKKPQKNQNKPHKTKRIWTFKLLSNAQKTTGTEIQVSKHFKLSDLPAVAENNSFKKLCGSRAHLFPVKDGQFDLPRNKPSLASGAESDPSSSSPSSSPLHFPAGQRGGTGRGSTVEWQKWGIRNISTAHHYFC